jgi:class 3 adenylate cyclase/TolB-like protein/Tfp pilus assembly protein PilF
MKAATERDGRKAYERRFAAILSGDVFRFSAQMGQDDERTLSQLLTCRQIIEKTATRMSGRVFGVAGDSWMAEFASPVQAVRCAAECQRAIEPLNAGLSPDKQTRYRMGVHMGDVIAEEDGLFGDEVNIAARLQELSVPGQLVLSDAVFRHVLGKIDLRFKALGVRRLKNIAKDVSAFAAELHAEGEDPHDAVPPALDVSAPVPGFGGKPAIAVLPFQTSGGDAEAEHIAEGLAQDLINGLSNLRWLPVISSPSSFVFKSHVLDAQTIGRALGARYLVTGSLRLAGQDLRLIAGLTDTGSGLSLWSQRYRLDFSKLFSVEDEILAGIVSLLGAEVERAEQLRLREHKAEDLGSWELIRRGIWHLQKFTKEDAAAARTIFEQALQQDPGSAEARIQLAWWQFWDVWTRQGDLQTLQTTGRLAREAFQIDPRDARAHLLSGIAQMMTGQPVQARHRFAQAVFLNPSLATAHSCLGSSYILAGESAKAVAPLLLSLRLNPQDPFLFHFLGELAAAFYMQGEWGKACEFAERSLQFRAGYWYAKAHLIASLARGGQIESARELAAEPSSNFEAGRINWLPFIDKKWNDYLLEGLKLAGCRLS